MYCLFQLLALEVNGLMCLPVGSEFSSYYLVVSVTALVIVTVMFLVAEGDFIFCCS